MKVLLFNGSPRPNGCTFTALSELEAELHKQDVETELVQVGGKDIRGCIACHKCRELGRCVFDDIVNECLEKAAHADGFVFGSPVYYASINGTFASFLDRLFYVHSPHFDYKPGACVVSARRAGTTAALDQLNKYITISNMLMVPSNYWNMVHGHHPDHVRQDLEGMQLMRALGRNMAWLLKLLEQGRRSGIELPQLEKRVYTNFINTP